MRLITFLVASATLALPAGAENVQRSSSPQGVQIQGNIEIKASQEDAASAAAGEGNTAKNTAGAVKGNTQVQGNTKIKASQKNTTAIAVGKDNKAGNEAGVIGGN